MKEELLKLLEEDARVSAKSIATMLGVEEKEVEELIRELREEGVIKKFKALVDWRKLGKKKVRALIQVKVIPQERSGFSRICKEIAKDERVKDVFVITGEYDLMLLVEAEDMEEIGKFVTEKLAPKREILGTYTHLVLQEFKRDGVNFFEEKEERLRVSF